MILEFQGKKPKIDETAFIADNATVIGNVKIGEGVGIWFGAVVRGDINSIKIGDFTNIQDNSVVHVPSSKKISIGDYVTVGHRAIIHGCKIGDNCLIGMGAIIMDGAKIGDNCIVGAGSLVTQGTKVTEGSLVIGSPAKVKRKLTKEEIRGIKSSARNYYEYSRMYIA